MQLTSIVELNIPVDLRKIAILDGLDKTFSGIFLERFRDDKKYGFFSISTGTFKSIFINVDDFFDSYTSSLTKEKTYLDTKKFFVSDLSINLMYFTFFHELKHASDFHDFENVIAEDRQEQFCLEVLASLNKNFYEENYYNMYFELTAMLDSVRKFKEYARSNNISQKAVNKVFCDFFKIEEKDCEFIEDILEHQILLSPNGITEFSPNSMYFTADPKDGVSQDLVDPINSLNALLKEYRLENYFISLRGIDRLYFIASLSLQYDFAIREVRPDLSIEQSFLNRILTNPHIDISKLDINYHIDRAKELELKLDQFPDHQSAVQKEQHSPKLTPEAEPDFGR